MGKEIIEKIIKEMSEISKLTSDDKLFRLDLHVKKIIENLIELIKISNDDTKKQLYEHHLSALYSTKEREVKFAELAYYKVRKRNAPKIRETEYGTRLKDAIKQIELELDFFIN